MKLYDALKILEMDPDLYLNDLKKADRKSRVRLAEEMLEKAKKKTRILLAKNHPDVGGDERKFKLINAAIDFLEQDTSIFVSKMTQIIEEHENRSKNQVFIKLS